MGQDGASQSAATHEVKMKSVASKIVESDAACIKMSLKDNKIVD